MSEFMGLLRGEYDAKAAGGFLPGSCSIHNQHVPHGPDAQTVEMGLSQDTSEHQRYENTMAFMFESSKIWQPTRFAIDHLRDSDYVNCWKGIVDKFTEPSEAIHQPLPFNPEKQVIQS